MLDLYRGLINIVNTRSVEFEKSVTKHIRSFANKEESDFQVSGFWNILLESAFVLYVKLAALFGILLTVGLIVVFFPLNALLIAINNILNYRASFEDVSIQPPMEIKDGKETTPTEKN